MIIEMEALENAQYRLAQYYLGKLRAAESTYDRGHEHSTAALARFDHDWSQIKQWWRWSATHSGERDQFTALCRDYPRAGAGLLLLRQPPQEHIEWLEAGLAAAYLLGDSQAEMEHLILLSRIFLHLAAYRRAQDFGEQALVLAEQANDQLHMCQSLILLGGIFYGVDEYELARVAYERAFTLSQQLGAKREIAMVINGLGSVTLSQGDNRRARDYYAQYLWMAETDGYPQDICMALRNLTMVTERMGDYEAAIQHAERCAALCREIGFQYCLADALAHLGVLAFAQKNFLEAHAYYQESLEISRQISSSSNETYVLNLLGSLFDELGDFPAALESYEKALALSKKIGERWYRVFSFMHMVRVYRKMGDFPSACQKLREGLDVVFSFQSAALRAKYLLEAAWLWHDQGQIEEAARWVGLLGQNLEKLKVEERNRYDQLMRELEHDLDSHPLAAAIEYGTTLDLEGVLACIMEDLNCTCLELEGVE